MGERGRSNVIIWNRGGGRCPKKQKQIMRELMDGHVLQICAPNLSSLAITVQEQEQKFFT